MNVGITSSLDVVCHRAGSGARAERGRCTRDQAKNDFQIELVSTGQHQGCNKNKRHFGYVDVFAAALSQANLLDRTKMLSAFRSAVECPNRGQHSYRCPHVVGAANGSFMAAGSVPRNLRCQ
jgi:hypothetical protein